jgi:hypothetical protein
LRWIRKRTLRLTEDTTPKRALALALYQDPFVEHPDQDLLVEDPVRDSLVEDLKQVPLVEDPDQDLLVEDPDRDSPVEDLEEWTMDMDGDGEEVGSMEMGIRGVRRIDLAVMGPEDLEVEGKTTCLEAEGMSMAMVSGDVLTRDVAEAGRRLIPSQLTRVDLQLESLSQHPSMPLSLQLQLPLPVSQRRRILVPERRRIKSLRVQPKPLQQQQQLFQLKELKPLLLISLPQSLFRKILLLLPQLKKLKLLFRSLLRKILQQRLPLKTLLFRSLL